MKEKDRGPIYTGEMCTSLLRLVLLSNCSTDNVRLRKVQREPGGKESQIYSQLQIITGEKKTIIADKLRRRHNVLKSGF